MTVWIVLPTDAQSELFCPLKVFKTKDAAIHYRDNRYMSTVGLMAINLIEREVND